MGEHATIKASPEYSIGEIKSYLQYYRDITAKTGEQLDWQYSERSFPYDQITEKEQLIILASSDPSYHQIVIGEAADEELSLFQIYLSPASTHGDKAKANELAKFLAKKLKAELVLFNGRTMKFK
ncbi:DUF1885 family protein [Bacillus mangrovi]|uniref:DUF1885 family protein n=1 Tax=Metabacillus mangrovi TaxID=1491830 RepID=A0A7X2S2M3_9BACI|nr:DUF1885 family protein [Metabacillus mangrovi]MTH52569.1 DUF1885 family protein [Metabacillus mangrovi]